MAAPRIKICCISSEHEARLAIHAGASALGLVSSMPSGPGVIAEELIERIAMSAPPAVATFLLTCLQDAESIVAQQRRCRTNTIQLCDRLERGTYREIREALPGIKLVQVVHVTGEESIEEAVRVASEVDAILLDSGNQKLAVKELGGTGRTHDWTISARIREAIPVPLFLAGGLNQSNVAEAVRVVAPFGLDLCSSVRTNGALDGEQVERFFDAVG